MRPITAMRYRRLHICVLLGLLSGQIGIAQDSTSSTNELQWLRQKVEELEQKVRALENVRKTQTNQWNNNVAGAQTTSNGSAAEAPKTKPTPELSIGAEGFSLASADRDFALQLKGV